MAPEIDLDDIMLTPAVVAAYSELAKRIAIALQERINDASSIPDERVRMNDDGTLTIFVNIPEVIDVSMDVPADQWAYRQ